MLDEFLDDARERMEAAVKHLQDEFATLRTDRASDAILTRVMVDYYGTRVPLLDLVETATQDRLLILRPYDSRDLVSVERAIMMSDLDMNPSNDGTVIRILFPPLTEERRRDLVRVARKMAEGGRVAIRHIRRGARSDMAELGESEDDVHRTQKRLQDYTDENIAKADQLLANKEKDLLSL